MELTQDNYYEHDTDFKYMSVSIFKDFMKCEAATLAMLKEDWQPNRDNTALLVGNWLHSFFESQEAHDKFKSDNAKFLYKYGSPEKGIKSQYKQADSMISVLEHDEAFTNVYEPGQKEVIVTGNIEGYPWKGKIDSLVLDRGYFCDLKTTADIHKGIYDPEVRRRVPFVKAYGYYMQMAVYRELIKQQFGVACQPFIFAVSKQDPPDKMAIDFNSVDDIYELDGALEFIKDNQKRVWDVMNGEIKPKRCGKCEYCRMTNMIENFTHASEIEVD